MPSNRALPPNDNDDDEEWRPDDLDETPPSPPPRAGALAGSGGTAQMSQKERQQRAWDSKFEELVAYKELHGHCNGPPRSLLTAGPMTKATEVAPAEEEAIATATATVSSETSLANWIHHQRYLNRLGKLDESRKQRLEALGFAWHPRPWLLSSPPREDHRTNSTNTGEGGAGPEGTQQGGTLESNYADGPDTPWGRQFATLSEYHAQHGHCNVKRAESTSLFNFVQKMRQFHKTNQLDPLRRQRLESLGFQWTGRPTATAGGMGTRQRTGGTDNTAGTEKEGNEPAPEGTEGGTAGGTDNTGETEDGNEPAPEGTDGGDTGGTDDSAGTDDGGDPAPGGTEGGDAPAPPPPPSSRRARPSAEHFQVAWDARFKELEAYKQANGHCNVPQSRRGPLAHWIDRQRKLHRKGELPVDRTERLNALGFEWTRLCDWSQRLEELKAFRDTRRHTNVPASMGQLGQWVMNQRKFYRTNQLTPERTAALEEVGLVWNLRGRATSSSSTTAPAPPPAAPPLPPVLPTQQPPSESASQPPLAPTQPEPAAPALSKISQWRGRLQEQWLKNLESLREYKAEHGNTLVPTGHALHTWVHNQRKCHKARQLTAHRQALLDELGFDWASPVVEKPARDRSGAAADTAHSPKVPRPPPLSAVAVWERHFDELRAFCDEAGHARVTPGSKLAKWADRQRRAHKVGRLDPNRKERLDGLGFEWSLKDAVWEEMYEQLRLFREEHGHANVKKSYGPLGVWVQTQRHAYLKHLTPERQARLEALQFDFSGADGFSDTCWNARYQQLREFFEANGHSTVPMSQGGLGRWVKRQKSLRKAQLLSDDRIRQLDELQFDWDRVRHASASGRASSEVGQSAEGKWNFRLAELRAFHAEHGHTNVPSDQKTLGRWVLKQRSLHKQQRLSDDRKAQLDELQFDWDGGRRASAPRQKSSDGQSSKKATRASRSTAATAVASAKEGRSKSPRTKATAAAGTKARSRSPRAKTSAAASGSKTARASSKTGASARSKKASAKVAPAKARPTKAKPVPVRRTARSSDGTGTTAARGIDAGEPPRDVTLAGRALRFLRKVVEGTGNNDES